MLPGSREVQASGPVKEDTVIEPKIAAVERREARVPVTRHAGAFVRCPVVTSAVPALRSLMAREKEIKAQAPRLPMNGPMNHAYSIYSMRRGIFQHGATP